MRHNGLHFYRIGTTLVMVLLALAVAAPMRVSADPTLAAPPKSDDFNTCGLNKSLWTPGPQATNPAVGIDGAFTGNSTLKLTVPAGQGATFSDKNIDAPRVMQAISDESFDVEVKFNTPLGKVPQGTWNIQGILVQDTTANTWLRFDVNSSTKVDPVTSQPVSKINYYIGYYDPAAQGTNRLYDIASVKEINQTDYNTSPIYLRVAYKQATGDWTFYVGLGNTTWVVKKSFNESNLHNDLPPTPPTGITFAAGKVGVFAGSTTTEGVEPAPGITAKVDYFRLLSDAQFANDTTTVKVTTAGEGKGTVNFPITNYDSQCAGNVLSLTASPDSSSVFDSWSGDQPGTANPLMLSMTKSYQLVANFRAAAPGETPTRLFIPLLVK